jgi:hypothetical protein
MREKRWRWSWRWSGRRVGRCMMGRRWLGRGGLRCQDLGVCELVGGMNIGSLYG